MLTVKLVQHDGHEQIYPATHVVANPVYGSKDGAMRVDAWQGVPGEEPLHFASYGALYVMNQAGQTIAKYWLGYGNNEATQTEAPAAG